MRNAIVWPGLLVRMAPVGYALPLLLLQVAAQNDCGWVWIFWVPFLQQPAVCCNGAAAAEPATLLLLSQKGHTVELVRHFTLASHSCTSPHLGQPLHCSQTCFLLP